MATILKILLSVTMLLVCNYGINVFGLSMWPMLFFALNLFLLVANYFQNLSMTAAVVAKIRGVLSLLAFALPLLAATVGRSSHMSESHQIIAIALALMAVFGCAFFLIKNANISTQQVNYELRRTRVRFG